jgi:hypothetical protein
MVDAQRDLTDLGMPALAESAQLLNKVKYKDNIKQDTVLFATYQSLIGKSGKRTRLAQIIEWAGGDDYDGLILFDECHKAKNLAADAGKKSSKTAIAVQEIQKLLPNARVVYCSATGVSEPKNMAFMNRLGLWGTGTSFNDFAEYLEFLTGIGNGGSEMYALHLKKQVS